MGSPLHGNDGRRRRTTIVIPATAGIHRGGPAMGSVSTGTTVGGGAHTIVIPATAGIHRGGPAMGSPLHANYGRRRRTHNRHSRDGGNPQRGAGDGFPSPPERRWAAGAPTIVIPATEGIHGGGPAMGSRLHRNDGRRRAHPNRHSLRRRESTSPKSSFPRRREIHRGGPAMGSRLHRNDGGRRRTTIVIPATAGIHGGGPAMGSRLHRNDGRRRRTHIVIPATAGIHRGGPAMGSRLHRNDGGRRRTTIVIPATAGIHRGGPAMGSRPHGNDGRRRAHPTIVIPATAGIHRGGAGDGFPSPPERRWAAAHTQSSFPRRRESTAAGRVPLSSSEQVPRRAGPRAASNVRYNDERRHRRSADATAARGPDARWIEAAGGATDVSELR